jgi:hypothetical protein
MVLALNQTCANVIKASVDLTAIFIVRPAIMALAVRRSVTVQMMRHAIPMMEFATAKKDIKAKNVSKHAHPIFMERDAVKFVAVKMEESVIIFLESATAKKASRDLCKFSVLFIFIIFKKYIFSIAAKKHAKLETPTAKLSVVAKIVETAMRIRSNVIALLAGREKYALIDVNQDFMALIAHKSANASMEPHAIMSRGSVFANQALRG